MASFSSAMDIASSSADMMEVANSSSGSSWFTSRAAVERGDVAESNILSSSMDMANANKCKSMEDILPNALLGEIFSHLCDARDLSRAALVNSSFRTQCKFAKNVRFNCKLKNVSKKSAQDGEVAPPVTPFKQTVISMVKNLTCVETLRLEIEDDVQQQRFKEDEVDRTSLWLSECSFVKCWLPPVSETLTNLTLIDYGPQAIFHPSPLLPLLSERCTHLQKLELRNMFLDSKGCSKMNKVTHLSLKCAKLMENGLQDISEMMPKLENIVFQTVVGLIEARLKSDYLKVLCLTFATRVQAVKLESTSLTKLQLKMVQCPAELRIKAPNLQTLALKQTGAANRCIVEFDGVRRLKEILIGGNDLCILQKLSSQNRSMEKVFLDVPCMIFDNDGAWRGVRPTPSQVDGAPPPPSIESLRTCCTGLHSLSVGPGFWYTLEQGIKASFPAPDAFHPWVSLKQLILHFVVQDKEISCALLTALVKAMPNLSILKLYVHIDSKVEAEEMRQRLEHQFPLLALTCDSWKKNMKFDCFDTV